jgi:hypothetical protein
MALFDSEVVQEEIENKCPRLDCSVTDGAGVIARRFLTRDRPLNDL